MAAPDPRRLAAGVLLSVEKGRWSDEALARTLGRFPLPAVDRALATRLVYGVLSRQRTLDHTIDAWASRGATRIDVAVRIALRLGLFQLAFLDRVPDHAAVSTSVDLAPARARGFVNAVLRRAQREGLAPGPASPPEARLGIEHSHPDWLVRMWIDELGHDEALALMAADNDAAPTCYRALGPRAAVLAALRAEGVEAEAARYAPAAFHVAGPVLDLAGLAVVQGEASQLVVEMLAPREGEAVLDACAAPGGKTAAIAARVGRTGRVVACDPSADGPARIQATLESAGVVEGVDVRACAVADLDAPPQSFDAVLVDAPCSGLGTLRQHPEIRWRRSPADLADLAARQKDILAAASRLLRPGGRLLYSTCTIARAENDEVVAHFLDSRAPLAREAEGAGSAGSAAAGDNGTTAAGFVREQRDALPDVVRALCDEDGALRTFPHRHGIDGFFAVLLRRTPSPIR